MKAAEVIEMRNEVLKNKTGALSDWQKPGVIKIKEDAMNAVKQILNNNGISTEKLTDDDILRIASSAELTKMQKFKEGITSTINKFKSDDSYEYANKDEEFLFNEYFKLEDKLNRWKK